MPSTGTPRSHTACGAQLVVLVGAGVAADRMMPFGRELADEGLGDVVRVDLAVDVGLAHAPAISCVTWEPKSRMRILSCMGSVSGGGGRVAGALAAEVERR